MNNKTGRKPESLLPVLRTLNQLKIQPMEHHKHLSCLGIAHLRHHRVCQLSCLYFPTARACFKAIDKEYLARVGILFDFQLLNSLLGLELGYLPRLDKFQIAFHTTNINFKWLWRGTIPTPSAGRGHVVIGANVCG